MMDVTTTCRYINELAPVAQTACKLFFQECAKAGIPIFITETYRSPARQKYLYEQGRTRPGTIVTWTLNSNHASRLAWDVAVSPPLNLYDTATLNKAGAIARKLGITWGGDWAASNIDRPHFEVKANWKMPNGYKLEGVTTIPTSSAVKLVWMAPMIAMDEPKKEGVVKLYKPTSKAIKDSTASVLARLEQEEVKPLNKQWRERLDNGTLTESDATGLLFVAMDRYLIEKNK